MQKNYIDEVFRREKDATPQHHFSYGFRSLRFFKNVFTNTVIIAEKIPFMMPIENQKIISYTNSQRILVNFRKNRKHLQIKS